MSRICLAIICLILSVIIEIHGYSNCIDDCHFSQSLDSPFAIPDECSKTRFTFLCQVDFTIDYTKKSINVIFGSSRDFKRKRAVDIDAKYDYIREITRINSTEITTNFFYSCTLGDECEKTYLTQMIPKLIKKDYTNIQKATIGGNIHQLNVMEHALVSETNLSIKKHYNQKDRMMHLIVILKKFHLMFL